MTTHSAYGRTVQSLDVALVNDAFGLLKILRPMLAGFGVARIRTYGDPHLALRDLLDEPPDLLLVNDRMKPIDGSQFVRMIRHRDMSPLCHMPVVLLSALARRRIVEQAFLAGAHQILVVPVSPAVLYSRIEWLLGDDRRMCLEGQHYVIEGVEQMLAAARATQPAVWSAGRRVVRHDAPPKPPRPVRAPELSVENIKEYWEV